MSLRLKKSKKKTEKNESRKSESGKVDSFMDPYGIKTERLPDSEMDHTEKNLKRVLDTEKIVLDEYSTPKRNCAETDISPTTGMQMNTSTSCENPQPVSVVYKTKINQNPALIVQKLDQLPGSPVVKMKGRPIAIDKTLKMSPSSLKVTGPKASRRPFARNILPTTLNMMEMQDNQKKQKNAKMIVKRIALRKNIEGVTKTALKKHLRSRKNSEDLPSESNDVSNNETDLVTSSVSLNSPPAPAIDRNGPRPVFLVQNESFVRNSKQMDKIEVQTVSQDTVPQSLEETPLTSGSEIQTLVKSIKTEPEIQTVKSEPLWMGGERHKLGEPSGGERNKYGEPLGGERHKLREPSVGERHRHGEPLGGERHKLGEPSCGERHKLGEPSGVEIKKESETILGNDSSSNTENCVFPSSEEISELEASTSSVSKEKTNLNSLINQSCSKSKSAHSNTSLLNTSDALKDTARYKVITSLLNKQNITDSNLSCLSASNIRPIDDNLLLLASKDSQTKGVRNSGINSEVSPNTAGSLQAVQETSGQQTTVRNFIQGTVLTTECQSTTGMKLVTIPQKTITSTGTRTSKVLNCPTAAQVASPPLATTELVSSPLIRSTQPNNRIFPRFPNSSPGLRHPTPFIIQQPDTNISRAAKTASPSQQIVSSVSDPKMILNPTSTTGATMLQNQLTPPSLLQSQGILNNSLFDQSLGGYRLGNLIIKSQNIPSGTLPQTSGNQQNIASGILQNIASATQPQTSGSRQNISFGNLQSIAPGTLSQTSGTLQTSASGILKNIACGTFQQTSGTQPQTSGTIQNFSPGTLSQTPRTPIISSAATILSPTPTPNLVLCAQDQNQTIQGTSFQSKTSQVSTPAHTSGTTPSASIQGTPPSPTVFSFQMPQAQGINPIQIHFPQSSQIPGSIVNPNSGSSPGQGIILQPIVQTIHQQFPGTVPVKHQHVQRCISNLATLGNNQQVPGAVPNLRVPITKQQMSQAIPNPAVPETIPNQSSATPQIIVINPNLPNNGIAQTQSSGSQVLPYSQVLQLLGNFSNLPAPKTNQNDPSTPKFVSSESTNHYSKIPENSKQASLVWQSGLLTIGSDNSEENMTNSRFLSTSADDSHPVAADTSVKPKSATSAANQEQNPPVVNVSLQSSEMKTLAKDAPTNYEKSGTGTASESAQVEGQIASSSSMQSSPMGGQIGSTSSVNPSTPETSPKDAGLKLGTESKPIPSDIPGPYRAYDHDVLIHVKYKYQRSRNKTRSMYIHHPIWRSMIKGYIRRELNYRHLARQLYQIPELANELQKLFLKQIETECSVMRSPKTQTILRKLDPHNLDNLKFEDVRTELQKDAPLLQSVLDAVRSEKCPDQNLGIVAALLLYSRSTYLSAVHHVISKILLNGGADTKTIDLLSSMGLCAKSTSYFGNLKRYSARNNNEEYPNVFDDAQHCSDDNMDTEMDTGMDASDEHFSSGEEFDIKSKLKDKILKKISPNIKKRILMKKSAKMKNKQSCSVPKKLKISSPQKSAKMASGCEISSVISNTQGTSSKTDKFKTAESCKESDVPLISVAKDKYSAANSFCDNVEINDCLDVASDSD